MSHTALRGALDPIILALIGDQPDHGYSLMLRIREASGHDLSDGSLYPALSRLEAAGKIAGTWTTAEGARARKVYALTPKGRRALEETRSFWQTFAPRLVKILGAGAR